MVAWGRNQHSQTNVPWQATNDVIAISAGGDQSLALKRDGTIVQWGEIHADIPAGLANVTAIASGTNFHDREKGSPNVYGSFGNNALGNIDILGLFNDGYGGQAQPGQFLGHSDFFRHDCFDYTAEDHDPATEPGRHAAGHFQDFGTSLRQVRQAIRFCNARAFERSMHRLQDFYTHWDKGNRWNPPTQFGHFGVSPNPDNDNQAWQRAERTTRTLVDEWNTGCPCTPCL